MSIITKGHVAVWLALAAAITTPLGAATLNQVQGEVLVSHGSGYQPVNGTIELQAGDSVIANPGSSAQIVYGETCHQEVQAGSVVFIEESAPCATQSQTQEAAQGAGEATSATAGIAGVDTTTLIVGGVAVAGGVGAAIALRNSGASP